MKKASDLPDKTEKKNQTTRIVKNDHEKVQLRRMKKTDSEKKPRDKQIWRKDGDKKRTAVERYCTIAKSASAGHFEQTGSIEIISNLPVIDSGSIKLSNPLIRTRSLENLPKMPDYGELMLEAAVLSSNSTKTKDHLYKILVIGDLGTGKTSLIKRYVHRFFTQHYRATIGVDFALKVLNWDEHTVIRLQLWDIAGQERYGNMTRVYYKEAVGAFIVFDVTRRTTFESVINWKTDLDSKAQLPDGSPIPCILLANKCDQPKEGLITNSAKMDEYCKNNGFTAWMETSAKDNINVDECAKVLIEKILELDTVINKNKGGEQFSLADDANAQSSRSKCSC